MDYCRSLVVDGRNESYWCSRLSSFELRMRNEGYPGIPKEDVKEICKQDIVDHPEKFEPFMYVNSSWCDCTFEQLVYMLEIDNNGNWTMTPEARECGPFEICEPNAKNYKLILERIQEDVRYMKKYHPEYYKELLGRNKVSDPDIGFDATKDTKKYPKATVTANEFGIYDIKLENINDDTTEITTSNKTIVKGTKSAEKIIKQNVTIEHPAKQDEQKPSINPFVDAMKSLTPEQLNMKLNVTGNGEQAKEITMSMNSEPETIEGASVAEAHTAKDIDFNNPTELVRVDEINYTYIAEAFD